MKKANYLVDLNSMQEPIIVLGASENPERYSYKAAQMLLEYDHPVFLVGNRSGSIFNQAIHTLEESKTTELHPRIISLYVGPKNQALYIEQILVWKPRYVIFNPGTENAVFQDVLIQNSIEPIEACTLVMLKTGEFKNLI